MAADPELIEFHRDDLGPVLAEMARLASTRDGWINLSPEVDPGADLPRPTGLGGIFASRQPVVPLASWVPGFVARHGADPTSVGLSHSHGPKVLARLFEAGVAVPEGWRLVQDNRRGLVLEVPDQADHEAVLRWLLDGVEVLCPAPVTGHWQAAVFERV
jgi:hypothetical protein